ncbi:MAG: hypothetical protein H6667_18660 [Ardenticatenaceae bacterium]|nr:hypothetical protein [Ardenticatenaceae bacterium]MCB9446477.1 hypothetical protein [Ardenticatenaceae bacterium]
MCAKYFIVFIIIAVILTILNWILGSLIVRHMLPAWAMIVANPPFGYVYVWTESLWQKGNYVLNGEIINEGKINAWQLWASLAQMFLYFGVWLGWDWLRQKLANSRA